MASSEGFAAAGDNDVTVALDIRLTPELIDEGFEREIVSKVQTMRKEAGFEVMDRMALGYEGNDRIAEVMVKYKDQIGKDVLATDIHEGADGSYRKDWNLNGEKCTLSVSKNS